MTTDLFVIANVKQLRTDGSFRILLPFSLTSWGVGVLNSAIFNSFHNRVEFGTILEGFRNFGRGRVFEPPPSVRHCTPLPVLTPLQTLHVHPLATPLGDSKCVKHLLTYLIYGAESFLGS